MLEIEIDVFSGMPNPTFQLSAREEQELVDRILAEPTQMAPVADQAQMFGLGYRGVVVRLAKTDDGPWSRTALPEDTEIPSGIPATPGALPIEFRLGSGPVGGEGVAGWLLELSERKVEIHDEVREVLHEGVDISTRPVQSGCRIPPAPRIVPPATATTCRSSRPSYP